LEGNANLRAEIPTQELHRDWVERLNVLVEVLLRETIVPVDHVDDNWPPGDDVAVLGLFIQANEAADDVGAEPVNILVND
jgi:hypothetical protein